MSCELVLEKSVVSVDQQQDSNVLGAQCEERTWRESIMGVAANQQSQLYSVVGENKKAAGIDPAAFGTQGRLEANSRAQLRTGSAARNIATSKNGLLSNHVARVYRDFCDGSTDSSALEKRIDILLILRHSG